MIRVGSLSVVFCSGWFVSWLIPGIVPGGGVQAQQLPAPAQIARQIDEHIETRLAEMQLTPAPVTEDAAFVRRVYLDLSGRIPTVQEARSFLANSSSHKRAELIRELSQSAAYARHHAVFWRRSWVPQADTQEHASLAPELDAWITTQLTEGRPYDQIVAQLLTATSAAISHSSPATASTDQPAANRQTSMASQPTRFPHSNLAPLTFLETSNYQPQKLAANSARAFLGIDLDCAECHDHPFARWSRDDFWEFAAFFQTASQHPSAALPKISSSLPKIKVGETDRFVAAAIFTKETLAWPDEPRVDEGRRVITRWMTRPSNPYFARNAVNRLWAHYLGTGLVEPLDDLSDYNTPSHPEVLKILTDAFVASDFDLAYLSQCIVLTRAYQRSSRIAPQDEPPGEQATRYFARMPVRVLTGEQLHDSLRIASGRHLERTDLTASADLTERRRMGIRFLVDRPAVAERSVPQALTLMNGQRVDTMTRESPLLAALLQASFLTHQQRLETLFLATLSRKPTDREQALLIGSSDELEPETYQDLFWMLVNSAEFNTNH